MRYGVIVTCLYVVTIWPAAGPAAMGQPDAQRPNILLAISDDQSWPHAGAYGWSPVETPAFDRLARQGVLFRNCFTSAPSCSPSRASLLTGRHIWQSQEAGILGSFFPRHLPVFTHLLAKVGYHVGYTGKGWAPGSWRGGGPGVARSRDPIGPAYNKRRIQLPNPGINPIDYAANFADFLKARRDGQPFFFWYGGVEPHRPYDHGAGAKSGKTIQVNEIPPFLPDSRQVRDDLLDYALEIDHFDRHLGRMLKMLEKTGELENTLVLVTSDNGMPFPRAKMQAYEYGVHVPLAICWPATIPSGRKVDDLVSFVDFAPTFLELAGAEIPKGIAGRSMMPTLSSEKSGQVDPTRKRAFWGKERHSIARPGAACYPTRAIRTPTFLYLRNLKPERWPAGNPPHYLDMHWWSLYRWYAADYILEHRDEPAVKQLFELHTAKRPAEELYAIREDPGCLNNLAEEPEHSQVKQRLWRELRQTLTARDDPRMHGHGDCFDSSPFVFKGGINWTTGEVLIPDLPSVGEYNRELETFQDLRRKGN